MSIDDNNTFLELAEQTFDAIADDHKDHDCGFTPAALDASARVRLARERHGATSGPAQVASSAYRTIGCSKKDTRVMFGPLESK